jgi:hypothetical protein
MPRDLLDVLVDLQACIYYVWQPLLAAIILKLCTLSVREYPVLKALDWLATWVLVGIILLIVSTAVR